METELTCCEATICIVRAFVPNGAGASLSNASKSVLKTKAESKLWVYGNYLLAIRVYSYHSACKRVGAAGAPFRSLAQRNAGAGSGSSATNTGVGILAQPCCCNIEVIDAMLLRCENCANRTRIRSELHKR
eukprot:6199667-Pleurochrysis_carterae.AAC.1